MTAVTHDLLNKISARHFYESKYGNLKKDKYEYFNNLKKFDLITEFNDENHVEAIQPVDPEASRRPHLEELSNKQTKELIEAYKKLNKKGFFDNWFVQGLVFIAIPRVFVLISSLLLITEGISQIKYLFLKSLIQVFLTIPL